MSSDKEIDSSQEEEDEKSSIKILKRKEKDAKKERKELRNKKREERRARREKRQEKNEEEEEEVEEEEEIIQSDSDKSNKKRVNEKEKKKEKKIEKEKEKSDVEEEDNDEELLDRITDFSSYEGKDDKLIELCKTNPQQIFMTQVSMSQSNNFSTEIYKDISKYEGQIIEYLLGKRILAKKVIFDFLKALFKSVSELDENDTKHRGMIVYIFLNEFIKSESSIDSKDFDSCTDLLLTECDSLDKSSYKNILNLIVETVQVNRREGTLLLLPKCLDILSIMESDDSTFKSLIIRRLIAEKWPLSIYMTIMNTISDISLNLKELDDVVQRIKSDLFNNQIPPSDLPAFFNSCILLSSHGLKGKILRMITDFFVMYDEQTPEYFDEDDMDRDNDQTEEQRERRGELLELANAKVITINNLHLQIRKDQDLAKEFLKAKQYLRPFNIAVLLIISKVPRFKQSAIDSIKQLVNNDLKQNEFLGIKDMFTKLVKQTRSVGAWGTTIEPLLLFAVTLTDTNSIVVTDLIKQQRILGKNILFDLYICHDSLKDKIIEEITARIVLKSDTVSTWFSLLSQISKTNSFDLVKSSQKLKDSFNHFQNFSPHTVQQLIQIFHPIFKLQPVFLNNIMLILKKSMFAREVETRTTAVTGYIQLLKNQTQSPVKEEQPIDSLSMEIFMTLRRSLTQQEPLRSYLYQELKTLANERLHLIPHITELLVPQFLKVCEKKSKASPPLDFSECCVLTGANIYTVQEPVDKLFHTIQHCLAISSKFDKYSQESKENLINHTKKLNLFLEEMSKSSVQAFQISISTDHYSSYLESKCILLMGVLEGLIEFTGGKDFKRALNLYSFYENLKNIHVENLSFKKPVVNNSRKKKTQDKTQDEDEEEDNDIKNKNKPTSTPTKPKTSSNEKQVFLSIDSVLKLMDYIYENNTNLDRGSIKQINFLKFIHQSTLSIIMNMVSETKKLSQMIDVDTKTLNSLRSSQGTIFRQLLPYLFQEISVQWEKIDELEEENASTRKKREKQHVFSHRLALQSLDLIFKYVKDNNFTVQNLKNLIGRSADHFKSSQDPKQKVGASQDALNIGTTQSTQPDALTIVHNLIRFIGQLGIHYSREEYESYNGDVEIVFQIIGYLYEYTDDTKYLLEHAKSLFTELKKVSIKSHSLVTTFFKTVIQAFKKTGNYEDILHQLTFFIVNYLGTNGNSKIDDEVSNNIKRRSSALINDKTYSFVISLIISNFEKDLDSAKELISQLRKEYSNEMKEDEKRLLIEKRERITKNFDVSCHDLKILCYSKLTGSSRERFFKILKKFYTILTSFIIALGKTFSKPSTEITNQIIESSKLTTHIQDYLEWKGADKSGDSKKLSNLDKARIKRESKLIPNLVQSMEKYESSIIAYEKAMKLKLAKYFRDSTSRHLVIEAETIERNIEENQDDESNRSTKRAKNNSSKSTKTVTKRKTSKRNKDEDEDMSDANQDEDDDDPPPKKSNKRKSPSSKNK